VLQTANAFKKSSQSETMQIKKATNIRGKWEENRTHKQFPHSTMKNYWIRNSPTAG
jgi:hypothetical protein